MPMPSQAPKLADATEVQHPGLVADRFDAGDRADGGQALMHFVEVLVADDKSTDEVVEPTRTRSAIAEAMRHEIDTAGVRRGRHGNIPL